MNRAKDPRIILYEAIRSQLDMTWQLDAACRNSNVNFFVDGRSSEAVQQRAKAMIVCNTCSVREECLDHALTHGEAGIWGGTEENTRLRMRRGTFSVDKKPKAC